MDAPGVEHGGGAGCGVPNGRPVYRLRVPVDKRAPWRRSPCQWGKHGLRPHGTHIDTCVRRQVRRAKQAIQHGAGYPRSQASMKAGHEPLDSGYFPGPVRLTDPVPYGPVPHSPFVLDGASGHHERARVVRLRDLRGPVDIARDVRPGSAGLGTAQHARSPIGGTRSGTLSMGSVQGTNSRSVRARSGVAYGA